jgi:hypothetical protein
MLVYTSSTNLEEFMFLKEMDLITKEEINPPLIIWEKKDRYALIAFLLLSVNERMTTESLKKFDVFLGITEAKNEDDESFDKFAVLRVMRDTIIREGNVCLDRINSVEDRYDFIIDELDSVIDGDDKCNIGNGYSLLLKTSRFKNLEGSTDLLYNYLNLVAFDDDYNGNKKRFIKHLARRWDIDKSVLSTLESSVIKLDEINKARVEIQNSDISYRQAVSKLEEIDIKEKAILEELSAVNITNEHSVSEYFTAKNTIVDHIESMNGFVLSCAGVSLKNDDDSDEDPYNQNIGDKIANGIDKFGDILCSPIEWLTGKIMDNW